MTASRQTSLANDHWFWLTLFCFLMGVVLLPLIYRQETDRIFAPQDFKPAAGTIHRFRIVVKCDGDGCGDAVDAEVGYVVDGVAHTTTTYSFAPADPDRVHAIIKAYQAGETTIPVWYNPAHPEIAVVENDTRQARQRFVLILVALTLPFIVKLISRLRRR